MLRHPPKNLSGYLCDFLLFTWTKISTVNEIISRNITICLLELLIIIFKSRHIENHALLIRFPPNAFINTIVGNHSMRIVAYPFLVCLTPFRILLSVRLAHFPCFAPSISSFLPVCLHPIPCSTINTPCPLPRSTVSTPRPFLVPLSVRPAPIFVPLSVRPAPLSRSTLSTPRPILVPLSVRPAPFLVPLSVRPSPFFVPLSVRPAPFLWIQIISLSAFSLCVCCYCSDCWHGRGLIGPLSVMLLFLSYTVSVSASNERLSNFLSFT